MRKTTVGAMTLATVLASACASNPARSSAAVPLEIPEPPPRATIAPSSEADPPQPEPAAPAAVTVPPPSAVPSGPPASTRPPAPAAPVAASPEPARPTAPPDLRPAVSAGRTPTAAQIRESLGRTKRTLDLINTRRLNAGKRADYDSAQRFLAQAEAAVKESNLMLAQSSAEKAATLAEGLR